LFQDCLYKNKNGSPPLYTRFPQAKGWDFAIPLVAKCKNSHLNHISLGCQQVCQVFEHSVSFCFLGSQEEEVTGKNHGTVFTFYFNLCNTTEVN